MRERIQKRKAAPTVDVSQMPEFYHSGLGGKVKYFALPSSAIHRLSHPEQFYPMDHPTPSLRGAKASTPATDDRVCEKTLLQFGVYTQDGRRLDEDTVEALLDDPLSGADNTVLARLILGLTRSQKTDDAPETGRLHAFSQWEAAFHDLLIRTGWVSHWVEYVTSSDASTPEAKEAAQQLAKLEAAAPEWARRLQSHKLLEALASAE